LLAERGKPGPRLIRGLLWALFLLFVVSVLANLLRYAGIDTFDITRLI
jgi:hypothetical protein